MRRALIAAPEALRPRRARTPRSYAVVLLAALTGAVSIVTVGNSAVAQSSRQPSYRPPSCETVTKNPLRGAMGGAAGGAIIGAIAGNAGIGAAAGAGVVGIARAVRRGSARNSGACY